MAKVLAVVLFFVLAVKVQAMPPSPCEDNATQAFQDSRVWPQFGNIVPVLPSANMWSRDLNWAALDKEIHWPSGLSRRFSALERLRFTEEAYRGRLAFLEALRTKKSSVDSLATHSSADIELRALVQQIMDNFGTREVSRVPQLKAATRVHRDFAPFVRSIGARGVNPAQLVASVSAYIQRVRALRSKWGTDLISAQSVRAAGFISIGAQLFSNIAGVAPADIAALDAIALLEPLTDDAIDRGEDVGSTMLKLSHFLSGESNELHPEGRFEEVIFDLLKTVLASHDSDDGYMREVLRLLHQTQLSSILIQKNGTASDSDLLELAFQKGGLAVLAAAKILFKNLHPQEAEYFFKLGAAFQLADDLVDFAEDSRAGHLSIWTRHKDDFRIPLTYLLNAQQLLEDKSDDMLRMFPGGAALKDFIGIGLRTYLLSAVIAPATRDKLLPLIGNRFPLTPPNLERVVGASFLAAAENPKDVDAVLGILDQEVLTGALTRARATDLKPEEMLRQLQGPPVIWQTIKMMDSLERWILSKVSSPNPRTRAITEGTAITFGLANIAMATTIQDKELGSLISMIYFVSGFTRNAQIYCFAMAATYLALLNQTVDGPTLSAAFGSYLPLVYVGSIIAILASQTQSEMQSSRPTPSTGDGGPDR